MLKINRPRNSFLKPRNSFPFVKESLVTAQKRRKRDTCKFDQSKEHVKLHSKQCENMHLQI